MSAAKMVADSTQSDEPATKKNKITVKRNKKGKKADDRKLSKKKTDKEDPTDPNLDLSKDVRPIRDYWQNRSAMLEQMFESVQGASLTMILPESLLGMDMKELKTRCLEQLEVMSRKRIFCILAGDELDNISSSGTEDELDINNKDDERQIADSTSNNQSDGCHFNDRTKVRDVCETENSTDKDVGSKPPDDSPTPLQDDSSLIASHHIKVEADSESEATESGLDNVDNIMDDIADMESSRTEKRENINNSDCMKGSSSNASSEGSTLIPMITQNHMELLELEMRARAIKAMLRAQETLQPT